MITCNIKDNNTMMEITKKIAMENKMHLAKLHPHLICVLCGGYFIDASTIIECLHTFCKTCIVRYLESSKFCPICEVQVHKSKPLMNIRPDKTIQDVVYKVVPGLFNTEMKKRREFYTKNGNKSVDGDGEISMYPEQKGVVLESLIFSPEDSISLSLQYYEKCEANNESSEPSSEVSSDDKLLPKNEKFENKLPHKNHIVSNESLSSTKENSVESTPIKEKSEKESSHKKEESSSIKEKTENESLSTKDNMDQSEDSNIPARFLQCPAAVTVGHLKKFIRMKYGLTTEYRVDIIYDEECLPEHYTLMDIAYIYKWNRNQPMSFYYRIFERPRPVKRMATITAPLPSPEEPAAPPEKESPQPPPAKKSRQDDKSNCNSQPDPPASSPPSAPTDAEQEPHEKPLEDASNAGKEKVVVTSVLQKDDVQEMEVDNNIKSIAPQIEPIKTAVNSIVSPTPMDCEPVSTEIKPVPITTDDKSEMIKETDLVVPVPKDVSNEPPKITVSPPNITVSPPNITVSPPKITVKVGLKGNIKKMKAKAESISKKHNGYHKVEPIRVDGSPQVKAMGNVKKVCGNSNKILGQATKVTSNITKLTGNVSKSSVSVSKASGIITEASSNVTKVTGNVLKSPGNVSNKSPGNVSNKSPGNVSKSSGNVFKAAGNASIVSEIVSKVTGNTSKLSGNVSKASGNVCKVSGNVSKVVGNISKASGNVSKASGNVSKVSGNDSKVSGNVSKVAGNFPTKVSETTMTKTFENLPDKVPVSSQINISEKSVLKSPSSVPNHVENSNIKSTDPESLTTSELAEPVAHTTSKQSTNLTVKSTASATKHVRKSGSASLKAHKNTARKPPSTVLKLAEILHIEESEDEPRHDDIGALDLSGKSSRYGQKTDSSPVSSPLRRSTPSSSPSNLRLTPIPMGLGNPTSALRAYRQPAKPARGQSTQTILSIAQNLANRQLAISSSRSSGSPASSPSPGPSSPLAASITPPVSCPSPSLTLNSAAMRNLMTLSDTAVQIRNLNLALSSSKVGGPSRILPPNSPLSPPTNTFAPHRPSPLRIPVPNCKSRPPPPTPSVTITPATSKSNSQARTTNHTSSVTISTKNNHTSLSRLQDLLQPRPRLPMRYGNPPSTNARSMGIGRPPALHRLLSIPNQNIRQIPNPSLLFRQLSQNRMLIPSANKSDSSGGGSDKEKGREKQIEDVNEKKDMEQVGALVNHIQSSSIRKIENMTRNIERVAAGLSLRAAEAGAK